MPRQGRRLLIFKKTFHTENVEAMKLGAGRSRLLWCWSCVHTNRAHTSVGIESYLRKNIYKTGRRRRTKTLFLSYPTSVSCCLVAPSLVRVVQRRPSFFFFIFYYCLRPPTVSHKSIELLDCFQVFVLFSSSSSSSTCCFSSSSFAPCSSS